MGSGPPSANMAKRRRSTSRCRFAALREHAEASGAVVWASHGEVASSPRRREARRHSSLRHSAPSRRSKTGSAAATGSSSTPRSRTAKPAFKIAELRLRRLGCAGEWTKATYLGEPPAESRSRSVTEASSAGVGRRRFHSGRLVIHRAIGDRLQCIFVDNGCSGTTSRRRSSGRDKKLQLPAHGGRCTELFLDRLAGVTNPEKKRKIIGGNSSTSSREGRELGDVEFLAQGTLYPDVIESVSVQGPSRIKNHHNVGGLPERCASSSWSRCASCSRTKSRLGSELGLDRSPWCAIRSRGPGWRSASSATPP